jgi:signal transduction histidine kinase
LSEGVPKVLTQALQDDSIATWDDGRYMWAAGRLSDGKVLSVRLSDAPLLARWNQLRVEILQIAIAVAVTASLIGWAIALQLTGRLRRAARAAQLISSGDLNERAFTSGRDEIAALARAVDTMTATLVKRIDRERAWTADAAHELRTPLTALVSAVELLDDGTDAQRVRQLVGRLRHLVEDLMRLARLEDGSPVAPLETVDLGGLVCEVIGDLADTPGLRLTVDAPAEVRVVADGARRALRNLIANAVRHGRPPIEVAVSGATAVITDHGPGYPRELLSTGPRRFQPYGPAGRTGLGLTIAVRELQAMHATLALTNGPSGASATVEFVIDAE